ncbi:Nucleolar protein 4 [Nakaseomyces bracarensis]|uniref:Nucleolar protein 4 n=1 Tax=Nakaseomyces bracarensis TaxID=273131 RepID=A0ABR4NQL5_9SACH
MKEDQPNNDTQNQPDNSMDMKTLFVRSIPDTVTDEQLADFFSNFAPIKHAVVVKDVNKRSRGFGFVSFAVEEDTKQALTAARKTKLNGHLLRVDIAKRRDRTGKNKATESGKNKDTVPVADEADDDREKDESELLRGKPKLIIRNMPWSCRDPTVLRKIFAKYGVVMDASIPRKRDGKLCGFAFVTMKKISNCKLALENTKDLTIDGRKVAVDFAVQKNRWEEYKQKQEDADSSAEEESDDESERSGDKEDDDSEEDGDSNEEDEDEDEDDEDEDDEEEIKESKPKRNKREDYSVFVRNVPYDATEDSLHDHFSKFGPVKYALPVIDRNTGLAKGTAFVAFKDEKTYKYCIENSPQTGATSLLIGDDVLPEYVYEGRVLAVTPTLEREHADRLAEKNAEKRKEALGKSSGERDKRNLYLLNEGRIMEGSKLASLLSTKDMEIREKSYNLRVEQIKKNPSLFLSLTRLAIRNLPRAMTDKSLKALARKAVVEFAKEVKQGVRHPLSKEEIIRSTKEKYKYMNPDEIARTDKKDKKHGIVKQAKIIMEVKGSTTGRSRGYGFVEYKDHKHALMGLRWLNAHAVTREEVVEGLEEEQQKEVEYESAKGRHLCVEFALENANVVNRRRNNEKQSKEFAFKRKRDDSSPKEESRPAKKHKTEKKDNFKSKDGSKSKSGLSDAAKKAIGMKRKFKNKGRR